MNLLESVLCSSESEKYTSNFKKYGIDASTLKLLSDEDLKIIGVEEDDKRSLILQHAANLQIATEKQIEIVINKKFIESVLLQMSAQLSKHAAAVSIALNRKDVIICNVKLNQAAKCLRDCVLSLDKQLDDFEERIVTKRKKPKKYKKILLSTVVIASVVLIYFKTYPLLHQIMS